MDRPAGTGSGGRDEFFPLGDAGGKNDPPADTACRHQPRERRGEAANLRCANRSAIHRTRHRRRTRESGSQLPRAVLRVFRRSGRQRRRQAGRIQHDPVSSGGSTRARSTSNRLKPHSGPSMAAASRHRVPRHLDDICRKEIATSRTRTKCLMCFRTQSSTDIMHALRNVILSYKNTWP